MPLVPLYGHDRLRARLDQARAKGTLPGSLLFHGPRGVGKQRLALWLGQSLLCTGNAPPCGGCQSCRYALQWSHPDLHWYFPRPRLKDGNADPADVREDVAGAIADRVKVDGLYAAPSGSEGVHILMVRAIVQSASLSPALGARKVFVIGDAERMVAQEGAEVAANAFLKLLEEPPQNTTIILTSSEPGALIPTIRSRVAGLRVPPLAEQDVRAFLREPSVAPIVRTQLKGMNDDQVMAYLGGAPGRLLSHKTFAAAAAAARTLLEDAASGDATRRARTAMGQGASGARGMFSDVLDALTVLLTERARNAIRDGDDTAARGATEAVEMVERAKELAMGNVNPQLITADLLRSMAPVLS